jgi:hypothetical protein
MRYMMIWTPDKQPEAIPSAEEMTAMGALVDEMKRAGVLLATEGFQPSSGADARLRYAGGKLTVVDGPFAETKELIAGFAILQVRTKEEMLGWGKRFFEVAGEGVSEVRLMYEAPPST